jgi:glucose-6-phosphate-specific signal transduction histidine kinase
VAETVTHLQTLERVVPSPELVVNLQCRLEAERRAIERELHDEVSGMLAAARMDVSFLRMRARPEEELREHFTRLDGALERAIRATRQIMQRLRPALLDHFGLPVALKHLVEESCRAVGTEFTLELPEEIDGVERDLQIAAFRVVQELLAEASSLTAFRVGLSEAPSSYLLVLSETLRAALATPDERLSLAALQVWISSQGGQWISSREGPVRTTRVVLPRQIPPA